MKNAVTNQTKSTEMQNRSGGEFRSFLSHLKHFFDMPEENDFSSIEPKIELSETKNAVNVVAEIPGIDERDLNLEISSDGYMTISGEKKNHAEHNKNDNYFSEVSYGMFQRTISLPWNLDYANAEADYEDGVLKVKIPKTAGEKTQKKKLPIRNRKKQQ